MFYPKVHAYLKKKTSEHLDISKVWPLQLQTLTMCNFCCGHLDRSHDGTVVAGPIFACSWHIDSQTAQQRPVGTSNRKHGKLRKTNMEGPEMMVWKRYLPLKMAIFGIYVSRRGCKTFFFLHPNHPEPCTSFGKVQSTNISFNQWSHSSMNKWLTKYHPLFVCLKIRGPFQKNKKKLTKLLYILVVNQWGVFLHPETILR